MTLCRVGRNFGAINTGGDPSGLNAFLREIYETLRVYIYFSNSAALNLQTISRQYDQRAGKL